MVFTLDEREPIAAGCGRNRAVLEKVGWQRQVGYSVSLGMERMVFTNWSIV
ncbi:MAG: hypothetical protein Aurels2KO_41590 [Aureliella sp.]